MKTIMLSRAYWQVSLSPLVQYAVLLLSDGWKPPRTDICIKFEFCADDHLLEASYRCVYELLLFTSKEPNALYLTFIASRSFLAARFRALGFGLFLCLVQVLPRRLGILLVQLACLNFASGMIATKRYLGDQKRKFDVSMVVWTIALDGL